MRGLWRVCIDKIQHFPNFQGKPLRNDLLPKCDIFPILLPKCDIFANNRFPPVWTTFLGRRRQISMFLDSWERDLFDGEPRKSISAKQNQISVEKRSNFFQRNSKTNQKNLFWKFRDFAAEKRDFRYFWLKNCILRSTQREANLAQDVFWCGSLT